MYFISCVDSVCLQILHSSMRSLLGRLPSWVMSCGSRFVGQSVCNSLCHRVCHICVNCNCQIFQGSKSIKSVLIVTSPVRLKAVPLAKILLNFNIQSRLTIKGCSAVLRSFLSTLMSCFTLNKSSLTLENLLCCCCCST